MPRLQKPQFMNWARRITFSRYSDNGRPCIMLCDDEGPVRKATVNVPDFDLEDDCVIVKDWSENAGMIGVLHDAGVIIDTIGYVDLGHVTAPVCRLTPEALAAIAER